MSDQPIWMRGVLYHSYHNVLIEPDTYYEVDNEADVETILARNLSVREDPPRRAQRTTSITTHEMQIAGAQPPPPPAVDLEAATQPAVNEPVKVMTTADMTKPTRFPRRKL